MIPKLFLVPAAAMLSLYGLAAFAQTPGMQAPGMQTPGMQTPDAPATDNPAVTAAPQAEASSTSDLWTPRTQGATPKADRLFHHRGPGNGEDDKPPAALRPQPAAKDLAFPEQTGRVGLAEDDMPLPGEMAATPEPRKPLFSKHDNGLAQQPDPWFVPRK